MVSGILKRCLYLPTLPIECFSSAIEQEVLQHSLGAQGTQSQQQQQEQLLVASTQAVTNWDDGTGSSTGSSCFDTAMTLGTDSSSTRNSRPAMVLGGNSQKPSVYRMIQCGVAPTPAAHAFPTADSLTQAVSEAQGQQPMLQPSQLQPLQAQAFGCSRPTWTWSNCSSSSSSSSSSSVSSASSVQGEEGTSESSSLAQPGWLQPECGVAAAAGMAVLHPAVAAYLQGSLGIAFSGGGFRYTYFVGVLDALVNDLQILEPHTLLSGASSGSLIAVFAKCGLPIHTVLELTRKFSQDCASKGVKGRLGVVLRSYLEEYLPHNAHELCDGTTFLAVTKVWPSIRTRLFSSFPTRADLIDAVLASCHLPALSDGSLTKKFMGRLHIDGGLLSVVTPPPDAAHTVVVCSMPSAQIARLPTFISRPEARDISISPDTYQPWPFSRSETTALALQPPTPEFIEHMVARGRADAFAWAEAVGFTHNGMPVFPTTTLFNTLPRQLLDAGIPSPAVA